MQDISLYQQILGLKEPWFVTRVNLDVANQRVDVFVEHKEGIGFTCPVCGKTYPLYDHAEERQWRHLDTCQLTGSPALPVRKMEYTMPGYPGASEAHVSRC